MRQDQQISKVEAPMHRNDSFLRAETVSEAEQQTRVNLAACYRLAAHYRMSDQIYTHISARIPGTEEILLNPYGMLFDEVRASDLVKVNLDGELISDPSGMGINKAGFVIHSALHSSNTAIDCVVHTHTRAGIAVSTQEEGLLPLSQHAMRFFEAIAYHDYEGVALDAAEKERLVADLGPHQAMILRNHGLLTWGKSIREAFELMYFLEMACQIQIDALAGGRPLVLPSPTIARKVAKQFSSKDRTPIDDKDWPALLRLLERNKSDYRN